MIWGDLDAPGLTLPGTELEADLTVPWTAAAIESCPAGMFPFAQKTLGNVWQAESELAEGTLYVDEIDWGDSLESVDMKVGRPIRVELSLYKTDLTTPLTGYGMVMLANPSSPDEVQGVCASDLVLDDGVTTGDESTINSYASTEATVNSPTARLVIQKIDPALTYSWAGTSWESADTPVSLTFSGELNVGGKVIYGLSRGGWKPTAVGTYRVTFYLPTDLGQETWFDGSTIIRTAIEVAEEGEAGGDAVVDPLNNLTYIDIDVIAGGGGGGGKPVR
ncbi:hypothetical protein H5398_13665 [Tessaracoccus sp. MC1679]|uniref:hypothetical protein n=1 Tax=Tessaracoccus sp. MC1679 TaxID=2760313 RepID=UPI001601DE6C|nr:hypothetical protein [Tessaracoccus sp. MC1679]MBB1517004.1 hypothetical protein [Tessaracoccus sp. MC1679]